LTFGGTLLSRTKIESDDLDDDLDTDLYMKTINASITARNIASGKRKKIGYVKAEVLDFWMALGSRWTVW
jgi:hypothetical protein